MAVATWRSLAKRAAMWRYLAKSLLAAARKMGALAEMAASPAAQEEVVVVERRAQRCHHGAQTLGTTVCLASALEPKTARLEAKP